MPSVNVTAITAWQNGINVIYIPIGRVINIWIRHSEAVSLEQTGMWKFWEEKEMVDHHLRNYNHNYCINMHFLF